MTSEKLTTPPAESPAQEQLEAQELQTELPSIREGEEQNIIAAVEVILGGNSEEATENAIQEGRGTSTLEKIVALPVDGGDTPEKETSAGSDKPQAAEGNAPESNIEHTEKEQSDVESVRAEMPEVDKSQRENKEDKVQKQMQIRSTVSETLKSMIDVLSESDERRHTLVSIAQRINAGEAISSAEAELLKPELVAFSEQKVDELRAKSVDMLEKYKKSVGLTGSAPENIRKHRETLTTGQSENLDEAVKRAEQERMKKELWDKHLEESKNLDNKIKQAEATYNTLLELVDDPDYLNSLVTEAVKAEDIPEEEDEGIKDMQTLEDARLEGEDKRLEKQDLEGSESGAEGGRVEKSPEQEDVDNDQAKESSSEPEYEEKRGQETSSPRTEAATELETEGLEFLGKHIESMSFPQLQREAERTNEFITKHLDPEIAKTRARLETLDALISNTESHVKDLKSIFSEVKRKQSNQKARKLLLEKIKKGEEEIKAYQEEQNELDLHNEDLERLSSFVNSYLERINTRLEKLMSEDQKANESPEDVVSFLELLLHLNTEQKRLAKEKSEGASLSMIELLMYLFGLMFGDEGETEND